MLWCVLKLFGQLVLVCVLFIHSWTYLFVQVAGKVFFYSLMYLFTFGRLCSVAGHYTARARLV